MAHLNGCEFGCNIAELDQGLQWPSKMGGYLHAIFMNQTGCSSGPLKWVDICVQYS